MLEKLKQGEKKFIKKFESINKDIVYKEKITEIKKEDLEKKIRYALEEIKKEIEELPEMKQEKEFHKNISMDKMTNILSQAIEISINKDFYEGLKYIIQTKNPYLIDAFHDLMVGYFIEKLLQR